MSACFIWAAAPVWKASDMRKAELRRTVEAIGDDVLATYESELGMFNTDDWCEAREQLEGACMMCEEDNAFQTGETTELQLPGMDWKAVITGGMSHGDNPTDAFTVLAMVGQVSELFDLLQRWSKEDCAKA